MKIQKIKELVELKKKIEDYYSVGDFTVKSREGTMVKARRMFIWYARENGYRGVNVTDVTGFNSDVQIYHLRLANNMIEYGDTEIIQDAYNLFGLDLTRSKTIEARKRLTDEFFEILQDIPLTKITEAKERMSLMVRAMNTKHTPKKAEIITANAINID